MSDNVLAGRKAYCHYGCGHSADSNPNTCAFFEYHGPKSTWATEYCKCGMSKSAHQGTPYGRPNVVDAGKCKGFEERGPSDKDSYYCGCYGWN